ncbi:MAG: hypothetical protein ACMUIE_05935 [Thermoplasmatota archaeon]
MSRKAVWITTAIILISFLSSLVPAPNLILTREASSASPALGSFRSIDDVTSCTIYDTYYPPPGGRMGGVVWAGDINNDGAPDIGLPVQGATGLYGIEEDGKVSYLYGGENWTWEDWDLETDPPDVEILGAMPVSDPKNPLDFQYENRISNQIESGDINGDGFNDLMVHYNFVGSGGATSAQGWIIYGNDNGWPDRMPMSFKNQPDIGYTITSMGGVGNIQLTSEYQYSDHILTEDLDGDGIDELINGYFPVGTGNAYIRWSNGSSVTSISDLLDRSYFGESLAVGDIDGNGFEDLVIGAPNSRLSGVKDSGTCHVIWDVVKFKESSFQASSGFGVNFTCSQEKAYLGKHIMVRDVTGDGRDDILIGVPGWDSHLDGQEDVGEILLIKGARNESFAGNMDANAAADLILLGTEGKWRSSGKEYKGSQIGRMFQLGDVNGDGRTELAIGDYTDTIIESNTIMESVGTVSLYDLTGIVSTTANYYSIKKDKAVMTVHGRGILDSFGFSIRIADIDTDGFDDIIIGSPGGDGPGDNRPRSGEVDIIRGCGLTIFDPYVSGEAAEDPYVFKGGGSFDLIIPFIFTSGSDKLEEFTVTMDPDGANISVKTILPDEDLIISGDPYLGIDLDKERCGILKIEGRDAFRLSMELQWHATLKYWVDVNLQMVDETGSSFTRDYDDVFFVVKDLTTVGGPKVLSNGEPMWTPGKWQLPGDMIAISGLELVYTSDHSRAVSEGPFQWLLLMDGMEVDSHPHSEGWELRFELVQQARVELVVDMGLSIEVEEGYPLEMLPRLDVERSIIINVDLQAPFPPENVKIISANTGINDIDADGRFIASWNDTTGEVGDPGGSGVKGYKLRLNNDNPYWVREQGGLFGTYYIDDEGMVRGMERIDEWLDFDLEEWGDFGPEPNLIPPEHFSVRWHGWLRMDSTREFMFEFRGSGRAIFILNGQEQANGPCTGNGLRTSPLPLQEGELHEIEIHFFHNTGPSFFSFLYDDDRGSFSHVPSYYLLHSSSSAEVQSRGGSSVLTLLSVDWTGRTGTSEARRLIVDDDAPIFNTSSIKHWYGTGSPRLHFTITEPLSSERNGSGINLSTIKAILTDSDNQKTILQGRDVKIESMEPTEEYAEFVDAVVQPLLPRNFEGSIQFVASDMVRNEGRSDLVFIGVDSSPPEFTLLTPSTFIEHSKNVLDILLRVSDLGKSGVEAGTLEFRIAEEGEWSEWYSGGGSGNFGTYDFEREMELPWGYIWLQFRVEDGVGNAANSEVYELTLKRPKDNLPPKPRIVLPNNNSVFRENEPVTLDGSGTWDDGMGPLDPIKLTWISNISGILGNEETVMVYLERGIHLITLYADDGKIGNNASVSVTINVLPPFIDNDDDDDSGPDGTDEEQGIDMLSLVLLLLLIIAIVTILVLLVIMNRRERGAQVRVGVKERTEDDLEYDESSPDEDWEIWEFK